MTIGRDANGDNRFKRAWLLTVILISILALSLGLGLGVGLKKDAPPLFPAFTTTSTPTSVPTPTTTPSPIQPINGAMNDTSLAAIQLADGNRHPFFQDLNGTLRRAVFSKILNEWQDSVDFIIPNRTPRNNTPLATLSFGMDGSVTLICYIDINDTLAITPHAIANGQTAIGGESILYMNDSFHVSTNARSLGAINITTNASMSSIGSSTIPTAISEMILFYVNPTNNLTALHGILYEGFNTSTLIWQNISNSFFYSATFGSEYEPSGS